MASQQCVPYMHSGQTQSNDCVFMLYGFGRPAYVQIVQQHRTGPTTGFLPLPPHRLTLHLTQLIVSCFNPRVIVSTLYWCARACPCVRRQMS